MKTIDLSGKWKASSACGKCNWETDVPGSILLDMEEKGELGKEGAFFRFNNRKAPEIMDRDFIFSRIILISDEFLQGTDTAQSRFYLEADGLDTLTEIRVNGCIVGKTRNMHRSYRFLLDYFLKAGENLIEITFLNSLEYIKKEHTRRPLVCEDEEGITTIPGFYSIRKSHCSYGWDWGPQMPDAGIWRPIRICRYDGCRFENIRILQNHEDNLVSLTIEGEIESWQDQDQLITGKVHSPSGEITSFSFLPGEKASVTINDPELWWPNAMGEQPLYKVECTLITNEAVGPSIIKTIGLRTLTIGQHKDQWGESFQFEVNNIPLFARGANYIPEDVYLTRENNTERLIQDCCEANFNCIRVWGGGVYPEDSFYDLCDRYGLIVWQDLMFACAVYDIKNDEFTENISQEIEDNLKRIRHHASLGLICGNNEMEWFFTDYDTFPQTKENEFEYIKQYRMVIPEIIKKVCPEIFYWSSSPSSGGYFEEPNSPDRGDCHFWDVWHGNKDFNEYKKHYFRFMSEFGFESLPSIKTIESFTNTPNLGKDALMLPGLQR